MELLFDKIFAIFDSLNISAIEVQYKYSISADCRLCNIKLKTIQFYLIHQ